MRRKVLSAVLSIMMCAASFTPAFGAEFSGGEEITTAAEEWAEPAQADVFSEENENGTPEGTVFEEETEAVGDVFEETDDMMEDSQSELEDSQSEEEDSGNETEELTEIFQADIEEAMSTDAELLQAAVPSMENAAEIQSDVLYEGTVVKAGYEKYLQWYKITVKKDGSYTLSCTMKDEDDYASVSIGTKEEFNNDETTVLETAWEPSVNLTFNAGKTYYIKVSMVNDGSFSLSVKREMTDRDCIEEILERQGVLTKLSETENKKAVTAAAIYKEYGNEKTYMQFIPKNTGRYNIKLYRKSDKYQNSISDLLIYDSDFNVVQRPISLKKGCVYYITNAYSYMDLSNCEFLTEYIPSIVSFKLVEEPKNKVLYKDCGITPSARSGWLPGIKIEVVYGNGKKEIISTDKGIMARTAYEEYLVLKFDGGKELYDLKAGKYSATIYPMYDESKSVKISNIEVKEKKDLPLYTKSGNISVNTTWEGCAYIRFKPEVTGKYIISTSSKGNISVQKDNFDSVIWSTASSVEVALESGKVYYISSGIQSDEFIWKDKLTLTIQSTAKTNLSKCKAAVPSSVSYTGKALTPAVTVKYGTTTLKKGTDYTLSYSNNTKIGTATVTIKGKGNYTGTVKKTFKIALGTPKLGKVTSAGYNKLKITWNKVAGASGYIVYQKINGKWKKIKTTKTNSYTHTNSKSFPVLTGTANSYTVKAYQKSGKTTVYSGYSQNGIKGKAALSKPTISKVSKTAKGIKLQWKTISGATGYVIQRYDSGKWVTKKTLTGSKTLTYTDTTAKKGKTYKYRIAAYRTVNKKKVLSVYSAVKSGKR